MLPVTGELEEASSQSGWTKLIVDDARNTIMLDAPDMHLDAGGIAKGYILDEAARVLAQEGISHALIEAGGDLVVSESPPGKPGWAIEVMNAPLESPIAQKAAKLANAAIATSGDTEQYILIEGVRYSHIMDPETGLGTTSRVMATVIAPDGITADNVATALTVLPQTRADSLLAAHPEVMAFVRRVE